METTLLGLLYLLAYSLLLLLLFIIIYKRLHYLLDKQIMHTEIDLLRIMYKKTLRILVVLFAFMFLGSAIIILTFI